MSDNLKKVEESMGAIVDNLQTRYHEMEKAQRYHDTQLLTFTTQIGHASKSIYQSVKLIENLSVQMSDAYLRMPLQSRAPTVVSESVGSSVFQAPRQDRSAQLEVPNPMKPGSAAAFREERLKEKALQIERSKVSTIDKDGSYRLHKVIVRVQDGKISQIEGMRQIPPHLIVYGEEGRAHCHTTPSLSWTSVMIIRTGGNAWRREEVRPRRGKSSRRSSLLPRRR